MHFHPVVLFRIFIFNIYIYIYIYISSTCIDSTDSLDPQTIRFYRISLLVSPLNRIRHPHGTHVTINNSTNNNVVVFFVGGSDLKIVYDNYC